MKWKSIYFISRKTAGTERSRKEIRREGRKKYSNFWNGAERKRDREGWRVRDKVNKYSIFRNGVEREGGKERDKVEKYLFH
jgi:hypothetical protein